jgi:hypothetical protein
MTLGSRCEPRRKSRGSKALEIARRRRCSYSLGPISLTPAMELESPQYVAPRDIGTWARSVLC